MKMKMNEQNKQTNHVGDELWKFRTLDPNDLVHFRKVLHNFLHKFAELEPKGFTDGKIVIVPLAPLLDHIEDAAAFLKTIQAVRKMMGQKVEMGVGRRAEREKVLFANDLLALLKVLDFILCGVLGGHAVVPVLKLFQELLRGHE